MFNHVAHLSPPFLSTLFVAIACSAFALTLVAQDKCEWNAIRIPEIGAAMKVPECRNSEFLQGILDPNAAQQLSYIEISFVPATRIFRGEQRIVMYVRQTAVAGAEWARSELAAVIASNIPSDSCDAISASPVVYSVAGGALLADFDVHYQKRTCTHSTCFRGWGKTWLGIPYPIFERCLAKVDLPGASATLAVHVAITPRLVTMPNGDSNLQVEIVPTTNPKEGPSELLKNIVGALTFGIGSKAIQDQFEHAVGEFRSQLSPQLRSISELKLPRARQEPVEVNFEQERPYFLQLGTQLALAVSRVADVQPSVACGIRKEAIQTQKFFESCVNPQRQYVAQAGDSLWKIAENIYGDGQFYHALRQCNSLSANPDFLTPGQPLAVVPYFELQGKENVVVSFGDTLWDIAGKRFGNPSLYRTLINQNRSEISDPNKLTTIVSLSTKQK